MLVGVVAEHVDEEVVLPVAAARRTALDHGQRDVLPLERLEAVVEDADAILDRKADGGLVVASGTRLLIGENQEAGGVVRVVLDALGYDVQLVYLARKRAGDGGRTLFGGGELRGAGVAGGFDSLGAGQVLLKPGAALR